LATSAVPELAARLLRQGQVLSGLGAEYLALRDLTKDYRPAGGTRVVGGPRSSADNPSLPFAGGVDAARPPSAVHRAPCGVSQRWAGRDQKRSPRRFFGPSFARPVCTRAIQRLPGRTSVTFACLPLPPTPGPRGSIEPTASAGWGPHPVYTRERRRGCECASAGPTPKSAGSQRTR